MPKAPSLILHPRDSRKDRGSRGRAARPATTATPTDGHHPRLGPTTPAPDVLEQTWGQFNGFQAPFHKPFYAEASCAVGTE